MSPEGPIVGAVLAAGASRRFRDGPKQLAELDGRPLLAHAIAALDEAHAVDRTVVVLGSAGAEIADVLELRGARVAVARDWHEGRSASLRAALRAAGPSAKALVLTLGDQPLVTPAAIDATIAGSEHGVRAARATYAGARGHPVVIPRAYFAAVARLRADEGGQRALAGASLRRVDCSALGADLDVDTLTGLERVQRYCAGLPGRP